MLEDICRQAEQAAEELIEKAKLHPGQIVVIGCSTSEICGSRIGSDSRPEVAEQVFAVLHRVLTAHGLYLAAQCCEHLNRAIIIEREAVPGADIVNVVRLQLDHIGSAILLAARVRPKFIGGVRAVYDQDLL